MPGFFSPAAVRAGTAYGTAASGYRADASPAFAGLGVFVLDDGGGTARFPPVAGTDGLLAQAEVQAILVEAMKVANRARAQIRQPLGSRAQVSGRGGRHRTATSSASCGADDAPVFGTDVAVQKARGALVFSRPDAPLDLPPRSPPPRPTSRRLCSAFCIPGASSDGTAYSTPAHRQPRAPVPSRRHQRQRRPGRSRSRSRRGARSAPGCRSTSSSAGSSRNLPVPGAGACTGLARAPNGIQIFPGGFPVYRGTTLVGAIGVSGDGVDQDDLVAFLGLANAGTALGTGIGNAPGAIRSTNITVPGGQLRYVGCPVSPFLDSTGSDACGGI